MSRSPRFVTFACHEEIAFDLLKSIRDRQKIKFHGPKLEPKRTKKKNSNIVSAIWFLFRSLGLAIHGCLTTLDYLGYRTATQVQLYVSYDFRLPAVSLFVVLEDLVNKNALSGADRFVYELYNCSRGMYTDCLNIFTKFDMKHIMNNLTYGIRSKKSNSTQVEYYKLNFKCVKYTLYEDPNDEMEVGEIDQMNSFRDGIITVELNSKLENLNKTKLSAALFIHDSKTFAHLREGSGLR